MFKKTIRTILIIFLLSFISSQKRIIGNEASAGELPSSESAEEQIGKYCPFAFIPENKKTQIEDYVTLDIAKLNNEERIFDKNNADSGKLENKIYSQDYFQIRVPDEMYVINTYVNDGVILKHKTKPAFIYILSPQWHRPSVYLSFDFNYGIHNHIKGYRNINMTVGNNTINCDYIYPDSLDGYARYVKIYKSFSGGMSVFVLIYKEPEIKYPEVKKLSDEALTGFRQFADS